MTCERASEIIGIGTVESVDTKEPSGPVSGVVDVLLPTNRPPTTTPRATTTTVIVENTTLTAATTMPSTTVVKRTETSVSSTTTFASTTNRPTGARTGNVVVVRTTPSSAKHNQDLAPMQQQHQPRPPLVLGSPLYKTKTLEKDIIVKDVLRQDNAVIIYWDTEVSNILGFRVIYRLFGDTSFKQAPPLEASEREFKIKNVPSQVSFLIWSLQLSPLHL